MAIDTILHDNTLPLTGAPQYVSTVDNPKSRLRKINLSVDIATQDELMSVYYELSSLIQDSGDAWRQADVELSNNLKTWAKGDELSGALHSEITAETDRAETAEEAIRTDLSNNYKVTVVKEDTAETGYAATYHVEQGGVQVGSKINIPKDFLVKSAALCTVTEAGVPYEGAVVGDKYIDFVINAKDASSTDEHVYLPINDLVDTYTGGSTQFATVNVDPSTNVITTNVSADLISAAAVTAATTQLIGTDEDGPDADTINGAKKYADNALDVFVTGFVGSGDDYVSAFIDGGKEAATVNVFATDALTAAVEKANSALQTITDDSDYLSISEKVNNSQTISLTTAQVSASGTADGLAVASDVKAYVDSVVSDKNVSAVGDAYYTLTAADNTVTGAATAKLTAVVKAVEDKEAIWDTLLSSISHGTDGQYVTTTVGTKTDKDQSVAVALTFGELSAGTAGVAKAEEAKAYVDGKITDLSVSATGDTLVSADSTGKAVTVGATPDLTAAVEKANSALQTISASGDYISVTAKSNNNQVVSLTTADLTAGTAGLAEATDVKQYVDGLVGTPLSGVSVNNTPLTVTDRVVNLTVTSGTDNGSIAVNGVDVPVTGLQSAAYTLSTAYDKAGDAAALQTAVKAAVNNARFASDAADDYEDIEAIINDLVSVRQALGALKDLAVTLTPAQA